MPPHRQIAKSNFLLIHQRGHWKPSQLLVFVKANHQKGLRSFAASFFTKKDCLQQCTSIRQLICAETWTAELSIIVPGGMSISEEQAINVTIGAGVSIIHLYWNETTSNYDEVYRGVSDVVKIEMRGPYSKTLTFTETTTDGTAYVEGSFILKKTEFIDVVATHQATGFYEFRSFIHDGTYSSDHYWNPELEIYVLKSSP